MKVGPSYGTHEGVQSTMEYNVRSERSFWGGLTCED